MSHFRIVIYAATV